MAYQVLARKSRPQDFSSLIGQDALVQALRNGLRDLRIAHAYLFSGIRGVGKTSAARVLAKALNCAYGPTPDPCNLCPTCTEITRGADLDVIEVDAATYSKVEQVRDLTESLRYGPARDRFKVVILDEIHRLSRAAFDALLKIVEEPPPHLVFIFATTEVEAVPATILSRCQEYRFHRVSAQTLTKHLRRIADDEGLTASDASLHLVARAAEGSVRDGVALLDQLATFGGGRIPDEDASRLLGGLDRRLSRRVLEAMLKGQPHVVSSVVRKIEEQGHDPRLVYSEFLTYCREALHLALGAASGPGELPDEDLAELSATAAAYGYEDLLRLLQLLLASEASVRRSDAAGLALEIAWLRAAEIPKLSRIEDLLDQPAGRSRVSIPTIEPLGAAPAVKNPQQQTTPPPEREILRSPADGAPASFAQERDLDTASQSTPLDASAKWRIQDFLNVVGQRKQPLLVRLREAEALDWREDCLTIRGDESIGKALSRPSSAEILDDAVNRAFGHGSSWRFEQTLSAGPSADPEPASTPPQRDDLVTNPRVQQVLDLFGGIVENVLENPTAQPKGRGE